ncbi:MAG: hypothetical protein KAR19_02965 [Bacteroidales bacterium]|nr:hypothetical protein [Bacteroidales bacterium]
MKKTIPFSVLTLAAAFIFSSSLFAQETEITIQVKKDGKVVQDTTYQFDDDADCAKKKHVKVVVSGDEHGTWHMEEEGLVEVEEEVYVITGDDAEVELEKILEEHGGDEENVKIIVIKKKYKKQ